MCPWHSPDAKVNHALARGTSRRLSDGEAQSDGSVGEREEV
jgi:hypothetical protein